MTPNQATVLLLRIIRRRRRLRGFIQRYRDAPTPELKTLIQRERALLARLTQAQESEKAA